MAFLRENVVACLVVLLAFNAYIAQAFLNQPSKPFQPLKELTKTIENLDVDARLQEAARSGAAFAVAAGLALGAAAPEAAQALGGSDIWAYRPSAVAASSVNSDIITIDKKSPVYVRKDLSKEVPETTIGPKVNFKGDLEFETLLKIDGKFSGDLESTGDLIIGPTGIVKGDIDNMNQVEIEGKVIGNIVNVAKVDIKAGAIVFGDITAKSIFVDPTAIVIGRLNVNPSAPNELTPEKIATTKVTKQFCGIEEGRPCGPDDWKTVFPACDGQEQSPINIVGTKEAGSKLSSLKFTAQKPLQTATLVQSAHNWELKVPPASVGDFSINFNGEQYNLLQFHFHVPSEHAIDGKFYDSEVHLVHKSAAGKLLVVGVNIEKGGPVNPAFAKFWATDAYQAFTETGNAVTINPGLNIYKEILPVNGGYYNYPGSLTTPPCSEGVTWILMKDPIKMSTKQYQLMFDGIQASTKSQMSAEGSVARPLMNVNQRTILEYSP
ncbi:unnamed protein product [Heterosigma akashiwo]|mmetsp:Transcript_26838/g.44327  ORF Transcript_26838/g.44327 Transcript_26838/m.44327 type:complete len:493 (-) Transcript_26838:561-2039(-)|eukprot:CAMPEP_0194578802 /NCGR_PEP_ID=MMETSP0292-20121207/13100_1 /TAXON_ID=39354 /ORGANISM="Heterosigma akashiwo, Strain CCMP2393" /LENGTH=492 /DNA_ID=CAMNT_0039431581 /DNA_START=100 /DNA_END=1578 /DNA_ORIENTATION=+